MNEANRKVLKTVPGLLLAGLISTQAVLAASTSAGSVQAEGIKQEAVTKAKQAAQKKQETFSAEAVAALKAVEEAIYLLGNDKKDEAVKRLETASGKLEVAMAADPSLKLIPVASNVVTYDLVTTPQKVKVDLEVVEDLLEDGDVQAARVLLGGLRSEIVTETIFLPLETYPDAIQRAVKEISANESKKARETLIIAMDSLVTDTIVRPLPVVLAQGAIDEAEGIQESDKDEALRDLDYASAQLKIARRLGYFYYDTAGYRALKDNIDNLKHALRGKSKTEQLFDDAKNQVNKLLDKFRGKKSGE